MKQNDHDSNSIGGSQEDVSLIYCHHIEDLQRIICELLCKNERLRMALADVKAEKQYLAYVNPSSQSFSTSTLTF